MLKHFIVFIIVAANFCFTLPTRPQYEVVDVYVYDQSAINKNVQPTGRCNGRNCAYNPNQMYIQYPHPNYPHQNYPHQNNPYQINRNSAQDTIIVLVPEDDFNIYQPTRPTPARRIPTRPTFIRPSKPQPIVPSFPPSDNHFNPWIKFPTAIPPPSPHPNEEYLNIPTYAPDYTIPERKPLEAGQRPDDPINDNSNQNQNQKAATPKCNFPEQFCIDNNMPQAKPVPSNPTESSTTKKPIDDVIAEVFGPKPDPVHDIDVRINS